MESDVRHRVGLLLGTEDDWPRAFEALLAGVGSVAGADGRTHSFTSERLHVAPFSLREPARTDLVVDRLAHRDHHPREWLKKVALVDDTYLLNSPFTFQSMERHAAYCAMIRLGLKVPETVLVPAKGPVDHADHAHTAAKYTDEFDLDQLAEQLGYPLYLKPYDDGAWLGVSRVENPAQLHAAYDRSNGMHLQAAVDGYDVFARALTIGAETMVMRVEPDAPMHERHRVEHGFLDADAGHEVVSISRTVNAFFRWEFNSCEMVVKDGQVHPIDYANACPDISLTSLHYYFPWAITALVRWSVFCLATGRTARLDLDTRAWFEIADRTDLDYGRKLEAYRRLADRHTDVEHYQQFCADHLADIDERMLDWVTGGEFERLLWDTVRVTYPPHEHDRFISHFEGLIELWVRDAS